MPKEYSYEVGDINENLLISEEEIEKFIEDYAREQIKKIKIENIILKGFFELEKQNCKVDNIVVSPRNFSIIRKYLKDNLKMNTNGELLLKGYFGELFDIKVWVKNNFKGIKLFSENNSEFKELISRI